MKMCSIQSAEEKQCCNRLTSFDVVFQGYHKPYLVYVYIFHVYAVITMHYI